MTDTDTYQLGMIGLGVMGRNLVMNIAEHGFPVIGYDKDDSKVGSLRNEAGTLPVGGSGGLDDCIARLQVPRTLLLLVPAGEPVDAVIRDLLPRLQDGDMIVDCGNSHFKDTDRRMAMLGRKGLLYMGVGISGGESGARHGPSIMPGGPPDAYPRVKGVFEAVAAHVGDQPMVAYLGPGSAGHYVKMVHNGIEYGLMELIAETYHLLKQGMRLTNSELHAVYDQWNRTDVSAYLLGVAAEVFQTADEKTGGALIDVILDEAGQKGTGKWTSQDAMELHVPVPTIDAAVSMRDLSGLKQERIDAARMLPGPVGIPNGDRKEFPEILRNAFHAAVVLTFAQGFALLRTASRAYGYNLPMADVAGIWQGGCIIRTALLREIADACRQHPDLPNLLLDSQLAEDVTRRQHELRRVVSTASSLGIPAAGFMSALAYFDAYRSAWLPANLIQAERDYFGAHTYRRVDEEGVFHTTWREQ